MNALSDVRDDLSTLRSDIDAAAEKNRIRPHLVPLSARLDDLFKQLERLETKAATNA
jgi:hypothetical protein